MQDRRSNKSQSRARRSKVALPVTLVLAEIVLGGLVLAGELGRQAALPRVSGTAGPPRHATGDALLAIGGVTLLYACLRGRVVLAKAVGKGSVWLRQRDIADSERDMCPAGDPTGQARQRLSTEPSVIGAWRRDGRNQINDGENAKQAIIHRHVSVLRNCRLGNRICARRAGVDKKSDTAIDKLS